MIELGLILTKDYKLLSVAAILDVFETVNRIHAEEKNPPPFKINLLTLATDIENENEAFGYTKQAINDVKKINLILIPAFTTNNMMTTLKENSHYIPYLIKQYQAGAEIATFCTGAFLLGASGLLNGKIATTHVDASNGFASAFPQVKLMAEKTVTQDDKLYTSGGATSSFHLLLHLIQERCSTSVAIKIAKIFAIDMDRNKQLYFNTFRPSYSHSDELVASAQQKIESNYQEAITIEELIKDIPASRRNMVRRFKQITGITPIEYLQQTRIEAAKKLLELTGQQMTEVIFNSGYNDLKAFRKVFKKCVGMTPSQYREKFQVK